MAKKKAKKKKVVVRKFAEKKEKTSADRPVPREKKKELPTRRPVKDAPKKVEKKKTEKVKSKPWAFEKPKTKKPAKPVPKKKVAKPVRKAKPKAKPTPKKKPVKKVVKPVPKKKPVKKAKKVLKAKPVKKVPKKRTKKEKVQVPPRLGWPPPGTIVDGKARYKVPLPGEDTIFLKQDKFVPKAQFAAGTVVPGSQPVGEPKKGSNEGVIITLKKGVDGWPANIRVTRDDVLVVNIFNKHWKAALDQLRANYGFNIMLPNLV